MLGPGNRHVRRRGRVRVHEIEVGTVLDPLPQDGVVALLQAAPSDHRKTLAAFHLDHLSRQQPQALVATVLLRLLEEELVAEAHAQQGLARFSQGHDAPAEAVFRELLQGRRESPDPREDDSFRLFELFRIRGELGFGSDVRERSLDRADIAHAIVDDRDQPSSPFDDGTPAFPPGDIASRRARPRALNVASAMWWRLRPRITSTGMVPPQWNDNARQNSSITSDSSVPIRPRSSTR